MDWAIVAGIVGAVILVCGLLIKVIFDLSFPSSNNNVIHFQLGVYCCNTQGRILR